jgi:hypothetical protein
MLHFPKLRSFSGLSVILANLCLIILRSLEEKMVKELRRQDALFTQIWLAYFSVRHLSIYMFHPSLATLADRQAI